MRSYNWQASQRDITGHSKRQSYEAVTFQIFGAESSRPRGAFLVYSIVAMTTKYRGIKSQKLVYGVSGMGRFQNYMRGGCRNLPRAA
jgi:hypothetical protein